MERALLPLHRLFDTRATSGKPVKINKKMKVVVMVVAVVVVVIVVIIIIIATVMGTQCICRIVI